jgi:hypothetical protein
MNYPYHWEHLITATVWSAPAERSGDGAFVYSTPTESKAVSRFACHRAPNLAHEFHLVTVMICTLFHFNVSMFQRFNVRFA